MSPLANSRHEAFAQSLAQGSSATGAYAAAGYRPHRANAARLAASDGIRRRVGELQANAAKLTMYTVGSLTDELADLAARSKTLGSAAGYNAARAALETIANLNGLAVDPKEVRARPSPYLPPEELDRILALLNEELERRDREEALSLSACASSPGPYGGGFHDDK